MARSFMHQKNLFNYLHYLHYLHYVRYLHPFNSVVSVAREPQKNQFYHEPTSVHFGTIQR